MLDDKTILVTGGAGVIGSNIVYELVHREYNVILRRPIK